MTGKRDHQKHALVETFRPPMTRITACASALPLSRFPMMVAAHPLPCTHPGAEDAAGTVQEVKLQ
jgi:hypothetical protein